MTTTEQSLDSGRGQTFSASRRETLLDLAARVEAANEADTNEMLERAFRAINGEKPERVPGGSPEWLAWVDLYNPFYKLVVARGFLDAAMTLMPEGTGWHVASGVRWAAGCGNEKSLGDGAEAVTPALALTAAALRARAAQESQP